MIPVDTLLLLWVEFLLLRVAVLFPLEEPTKDVVGLALGGRTAVGAGRGRIAVD